MTSIVMRPCSSSIALWIRFSFSESKALVASSRINNDGLRNSARARDKRCLSPPDNRTPRSPTTVSIPAGSAETNPSAAADLSALLANVSGMLAPLAVAMLIYDQNALLGRSGRRFSRFFEQEQFEAALVNLLRVPPGLKEEPLQALRLLSLRSGYGLGIRKGSRNMVPDTLIHPLA